VISTAETNVSQKSTAVAKVEKHVHTTNNKNKLPVNQLEQSMEGSQISL